MTDTDKVSKKAFDKIWCANSALNMRLTELEQVLGNLQNVIKEILDETWILTDVDRKRWQTKLKAALAESQKEPARE